MYKTIDYKNWDRREIYEFYSSKRLPHYVVAANIDVTKLLEYKRRNGISFYLSLIYLATEALNSIENFHLRIVDGKVVRYNRIETNFTHKRAEEQLFHCYTAPFEGSLREYVEKTSRAIAGQTSFLGGLGESSLRGLHEHRHDAIPRINWGKYIECDGRWKLNISFTANHRFIDGYHIGLFFKRPQLLIDDLGNE